MNEHVDLNASTDRTRRALTSFWAANFNELSLVRQSTYDVLNALIRADERERIRCNLPTP